MSGISKSQVSRLCQEFDERVGAFLERLIAGGASQGTPLAKRDGVAAVGDWPYLWIDATDVKARAEGRIVAIAVIVAVGVDSDGRREVPDVLAYMTFPVPRRAKLHSTNPLERLNGEIKRRTEVPRVKPEGRLGIFSNEAAITRLADAILLEQNDAWSVQRPSAVHPSLLRTAWPPASSATT